MMTKRSQETQQMLLQDVEAYSFGEVPSPLDLLRAATLELWDIAVRRRGKEFVMVARGDVHRHPEIDDGTPISTSAIAWFDRKGRFCRTHNRLYALGQPLGREIQSDGVDR
jgi:hypothetical protein